MPASDLLWNSAQGQVFQVYGTKRKSSCDQEECQMADVSVDGSGDCKRQCMERSPGDGLEINHNDPQLNPLQHCQTFTQHSQPMAEGMCAIPQNAPQFISANPSPVLPPAPSPHFISVQQYYGGPQFHQLPQSPYPEDQYPAHNTAESNMVMDLCDETYTVISGSGESAGELEAAHNQMDSDFTPDQHQYCNNTFAFCDSNCIGESGSPSTRVRCYCKPNWDGSMDVRPYVSDYY